MAVNSTTIDLPSIDLGTILDSILILIFAYILNRIITFILTWLSENVGIYRINVKMVIPLLKYSIYIIAIYYILNDVLNLSSEHLIVFGGLLGAGIGFGLKDLFADVVGGIVITLEKPYQIGDKIKIRDNYGEVSDIGIRATKIITFDDDLVSIPNFLIFSESVASANSGNPEMMKVIDIYIDHDSDTELAIKILKEALITSKYVFISKKRPYTVLIKDHPYYKCLRAKAYVNDLRYEFEFESDVTRRTLNEFSKNSIKTPKLNIISGEGG
ncbi:MAG: mechanosensitive ion channel family protein [Methanosarcinaceae archaeon]|nr:mechanosensitive ion channel family protein [Methanosarcinaceae archaeon]